MDFKVLYVEDNPQNMRLVRKILIGAGYTVVEATSGTEALSQIETENPALVLMDVNLPDIDGLEVTQRLRQDERYTHLPIVALTANAMHGDRERCMAAGCSGYIPKPITTRELLSVVESFAKHAEKRHAGTGR